MKTEQLKMLAGELYDPMDPELAQLAQLEVHFNDFP